MAMMRIDEAIETFGRRIGLGGRALAQGNHLALGVGTRLITVERGADELLVTVSAPPSHDAPAQWLAACRRAHAALLDQHPVQAALRTDGDLPAVMAVLRLAESHVDEVRVEQAIAYLAEWLEPPAGA
jgi:type III secretion system chaperone SycN